MTGGMNGGGKSGMNTGRPIEERITRWLEEEAPGDLPHLVLESAFEQTRALPQDRPSMGSRPVARLFPSRRAALLLVAALLAAAAGGFLVAGGLPHPTPSHPLPANLLDAIRGSGQIRIAVRPDHPQAPIGGAATGFDTDVAAELARRLGFRPDIVIVDVQTMLGPDQHTWDVALPSTADWLIATPPFLRSTPYYAWPHRLVVAVDSTANGIKDLATGPICAIAGDPSESWLRGGYGGTSSSPATTTVITRSTDADCLAALAAGDAVAAVTAQLSDAELQVLGTISVIGGPDAEPRSALVHAQTGVEPDSTSLLAAVDDALAAMRADGTLTRFSQSRFGGADLSQTQP
jgi:cystine transport system substrate-binding protein